MTTEKIPNQCELVDGKFVVPCAALTKASDGSCASGKQRGLFEWVYTQLSTGKLSRSFFGLKTGEYASKGVAMNYCPFCGVSIATHLQPQKTGNTPVSNDTADQAVASAA